MDDLNEQLYRACEVRNWNEARRLIEIGASGNYRGTHMWTVLHEAVCAGGTSTVQLLLSKGANVNSRSGADRTPLHVAAYNGNLELIELLLQHGADSALRSGRGETAKDEAQERYLYEIVKFLSNFHHPEIKEPDCP